jgi:hypothetical protein
VRQDLWRCFLLIQEEREEENDYAQKELHPENTDKFLCNNLAISEVDESICILEKEDLDGIILLIKNDGIKRLKVTLKVF